MRAIIIALTRINAQTSFSVCSLVHCSMLATKGAVRILIYEKKCLEVQQEVFDLTWFRQEANKNRPLNLQTNLTVTGEVTRPQQAGLVPRPSVTCDL